MLVLEKLLHSILVYLKYKNIKFFNVGKNCNFKSLKSDFFYPDKIIIGDNVHIGSNAMLDRAGGIKIDNGVIFCTKNNYLF